MFGLGLLVFGLVFWVARGSIRGCAAALEPGPDRAQNPSHVQAGRGPPWGIGMERKSRLLWIAALLAGAGLVGADDASRCAGATTSLPRRLANPCRHACPKLACSATLSTRAIHPDALLFTPQYPLWSDGTAKRRWIRLPPNTSIDAHDADAWNFPPGTRLWKEFAYGRPIETRLIERLADGSWRFAVYVWNAEGTEALLAPEFGIAKSPAPSAPGGSYPILAQADCRACHAAAKVPVLGFGALQLSSDRDPLAVHPPSPSQTTWICATSSLAASCVICRHRCTRIRRASRRTHRSPAPRLATCTAIAAIAIIRTATIRCFQ